MASRGGASLTSASRGGQGARVARLFGMLLCSLPSAQAAAAERAPVKIEVLRENFRCDDLARVRALPNSAWRLPATLTSRSNRHDEALWLRLAAGDPVRQGGWSIAAPPNRTPTFHWFEPPAYREFRLDAADDAALALSFRHIGRALEPHPAGPVYVCVAAHRIAIEELTLAPTDAFRALDLAASAWRSAAFGVIVAMGLFLAAFSVALRELVFVRYFLYLSAFVLYLAAETGAAYRVPPLSALDVASMTRLSGMAIDLSAGLALLFALEFTQIRRRTPRLARWARRIAWILLALAVAHGGAFLLDRPAIVAATIAASNLLVAGGGLLLLVAVSISALRGDRYARFFLVGWTPLITVAFVASAQQLLLAFTPAGMLDAMLGAGAFESVVLAVGLADRTLTYRRELDRARELADRDALSGLLNRRALVRLADALVSEGLQRKQPLALVMFDLDHFKAINDRRGHAAGDTCIRQFASQLASEVRREDLAARYGGEEFLVALPGTGEEPARALAERVRARIERDGAEHDGERIEMRVSAGVAAGPAGTRFEQLVERADRALYVAKSSGRNRVAVDRGP